MTEKNRTIWHTPKEKPERARAFICIAPLYRNGYSIRTMKTCSHKATMNGVIQWAYLDQILASSKALDVAIKALERLRDLPEEDSDKWFMYCCPSCVLSEIESIMKGDK